MSDLAGGLLVLLGTAIFIGIIFLVINKRKTDTAQVVQTLAAREGWRYEQVDERLTSGYRLIGNGWTYEAIKAASSTSSGPGSSEISNLSRWFTNQVFFDPGILLIGPRQPNVELGGIGEVLKQTMLRLMIGIEADDALGIEESLIGRMALRERYMVWTNQEEKAREVLTVEVENALIRYPGKIPPVVKINSAGLEVKVISHLLEKPEEIAGLIAIGEAFLE
jgi:hypothetical protein